MSTTGPYPDNPVAQAGFNYVPPPGTSTQSKWALILGIVSLFIGGIFLGIPAIILGVSGKRTDRYNKVSTTSANAGIFLGSISCIITFVAAFIVLIVYTTTGSILKSSEESAVRGEAKTLAILGASYGVTNGTFEGLTVETLSEDDKAGVLVGKPKIVLEQGFESFCVESVLGNAGSSTEVSYHVSVLLNSKPGSALPGRCPV